MPEPLFASRSLLRALLMPQMESGSCYRCGKSDKEQPVRHDRRKRGPEIRPKLRFSQADARHQPLGPEPEPEAESSAVSDY